MTSNNFPGNPWAEVHSEVKPDTAGLMASLHLLAYEQRTLALTAFLSHCAQSGGTGSGMSEMHEQIVQRLGLREDKDNDL